MSAIRSELMTAAKVTPKRGESDDDLHRRLVKAISEDISEETWQGLSSEAQDWNNSAADALGAGKQAPAFPDAAASPSATTGSDAPATGRRRGAAADKPAEPKVGDRVVITNKRGKAIEGTIVEMTEADVVLNKDGEEGKEEDDVEIPRANIVSMALSNTPEAAAAGSTTEASKAAGDEAPVPEVGDVIKVETHRGKIVTGKLSEVNGDDIVLVDTKGEEHELMVSKLKTWSMVDKGKPTPAPAESTRRKSGDAQPPVTKEEAPNPRRRGAAAEEPATERKRVSNEKGVSVSHRISEIMIDNPEITQDKLAATLKKEGIEFRDNTLQLNYSATKKFLELLKSKGKFK